LVEASGDLVVSGNNKEIARLAVDASPDARLLIDESARLLLLTDATTRYADGVLSDAAEAGNITLVETALIARVALKITLLPTVVEGLAPVRVDPNGYDVREIVVTPTDAQQGPRIAVSMSPGDPLQPGAPPVRSFDGGISWSPRQSDPPAGRDRG
jgi:hypothetical protein